MRKTTAAIGSTVFFFVAPVVVAGLIPYRLSAWRARDPVVGGMPVRILGFVLVLVGASVLVSAFVRFVREGSGTPAPVAPTERLVVGGLYQYVRNPMYVAVIAIIIGQALALGSRTLLVYALVVWMMFAAFVKLYEEPVLERRYGAEYDAYRRAVRAWWPRLRR